jgi:hypothetical protein
LKRIGLATAMLSSLEREKVMKRSFVVVAMLSISFCGSAFAQPDDSGISSDPKSADSPSGNPNFPGPRPLIETFSADQQAALAYVIAQYANQDPVKDSSTPTLNVGKVVSTHEQTMINPSQVNVHEANYKQLFTFHHAYIGALEAYIAAYDTSKDPNWDKSWDPAWLQKFVPLPKWIPDPKLGGTPIPPAFQINLGLAAIQPPGAKDPDDDIGGVKGKVIQNANPKISWAKVTHKVIASGKFTEDVTSSSDLTDQNGDTTPSANILANTLIPAHNNTHNTIAGHMADMSSPTAPIFWLYHAFIDDIWVDWQSVQKTQPKKDDLTARPQLTGPRVLQGTVRVEDGKVFLTNEKNADGTPTGGLEVKDDPAHKGLAALLATVPGQPVTIEGTTHGNTVTPEDIITYNGMSALTTTGDETGTFRPMDEIRITGVSGNDLKVQVPGTDWVDGNGRGLVPASSVNIAGAAAMLNMMSPAMPGMDMSKTPGMTKAMDAGGCASGCGSGCACGSGKACSCGCGCGKKQP